MKNSSVKSVPAFTSKSVLPVGVNKYELVPLKIVLNAVSIGLNRFSVPLPLNVHPLTENKPLLLTPVDKLPSIYLNSVLRTFTIAAPLA